jgi:hypothetical protein
MRKYIFTNSNCVMNATLGKWKFLPIQPQTDDGLWTLSYSYVVHFPYGNLPSLLDLTQWIYPITHPNCLVG